MADSPTGLRAPSPPSAREASPDAARRRPRGVSGPAGPNRLASAQRRERLREFQTSLSDKLQRAQSAPLAVNRLGLQIGPHRLLVDLANAGEILPVPDIAPVPLTKAWYRGLANVRGNLLGIVDLSLYAGGPATPLDKDSRVLAFSTDLRFSVGILVSRMLGLRSAAELSSETAASDTDTLFAPWVREKLVDAQEVHWQELDLSALTADERFVDIARA
jgi:twitching motility protein PilI